MTPRTLHLYRWAVFILLLALLINTGAVYSQEGDPVLTDEPTQAAPTEAPTEAPTDIPTELPTEAPTDIPTELPTELPTDVPTELPTEVPTEIPTEIPTDSPTELPTDPPTDVVTELPTEAPTDAPTGEATEPAVTDLPTETPPAPVSAPPAFVFLSGDSFAVAPGATARFGLAVADDTGAVSVTVAGGIAGAASGEVVAPVESAPPFNTFVAVTYNAPADFAGDTLTLTAIDADGQTTSATVRVDPAAATPEATAEATPELTPEVTAEVTAEATAEATPQATPLPQPGAVAGEIFVINSAGDGADANLNDNLCRTAANSCTLRAAIQQANQTAGAQTIRFNIPGANKVITPASPLPPVGGVVLIDGTSQPGYTNRPLVAINGASVSVALLITGNGVTVRGLAIYGAATTNVDVQFAANTIIEGCWIGLNLTGAKGGNSSRGVNIQGGNNNRIGGTTAAARNVISGNDAAAISISGVGATGNVVQGNYIGTNAAGTAALANDIGVFINSGASNNTVGGTTAGAGNLISGNYIGVYIIDVGTGNRVQGNRIGTNAAGTAALGNRNGVVIDGVASNNIIGGTAAGAGNVISGNFDTGVGIFVTNSNRVQGNRIGTNAAGTAALGNGTGVVIDNGAMNNIIGGTTAAERNVISGNRFNGVLISGAETVLNRVQGNRIGTNGAGTAALGNGTGIYIDGSASNNTVGGTVTGAGNLISGNRFNGVLISGVWTSTNFIQGNTIGLNAARTAGLRNGSNGVLIQGGAANNTVGGTTAAARNIISGNTGSGVRITGAGTTDNLVQGNYTGTNPAGTAALGNGTGVVIDNGASRNTVGGTTAGAGNLISGNRFNGVLISGAGTDLNRVQGNRIGTNGAGTSALGNGTGIYIDGGASNNTVGGTTAGAGNLISGNRFNGVLIDGANTASNLVQGNTIGLNAARTAGLRNGSNGVLIQGGASGNWVGGLAVVDRNFIAFNGGSGVVVSGETTLGNRINTNSIYSNTRLGIDLLVNGVAGNTPNDLNDIDAGANSRQNFPVIRTVSTTGVTGALNSRPDRQYRIEVFRSRACDASGFGEGAIFVGAVTVTTNAAGNTSFSLNATLPRGAFVTTTASDTGTVGDTSEFSRCVRVP